MRRFVCLRLFVYIKIASGASREKMNTERDDYWVN